MSSRSNRPHPARRKPKKEADRAEFSIVSAVLGGISVITWFIPVMGFTIALVGLGFGFAGRHSSRGQWGKAGLILNILGLLGALAYIGLSTYWGM